MLRVAAPRAAGFVLLIFHVDALAVLRSYENKLLAVFVAVAVVVAHAHVLAVNFYGLFLLFSPFFFYFIRTVKLV